jgi:spermidine synthase
MGRPVACKPAPLDVQEPEMSARTGAVLCVFLLSGVAGLSYELTWLRYLIDLFGATAPAVSTTVSIFFAGLALGSFAGGRFFQRRRNPALAYAALELAIGGAAAAVPPLFWLADLALTKFATADSPALLVAASGAVLLLPATLIGATFPAMAAVLRHGGNSTRSTGLFYGFNTLGAVAGCVLASFALIPVFGQAVTSWMLVSINIAAAAAMFLISRTGKVSVADTAPEHRVKDTTNFTLLAVVSGFLAIATEVLWTRALALSFPASVYVFTLILCAYLIGIGVGSLAVARLTRRRPPDARWLWGLYLAIAGGSAVLLSLFPQVASWSIQLLATGTITSWPAWITWIGGISVLIMLPVTLAMGAALPVLIGLATSDARAAPSVAGRLYGLNTLAGVAGSLTATFWLMPAMGLSAAMLACTLGYLALAITLFRHFPRTALWAQGIVLATGIAIIAAGLTPEVNPLRERPGQRLIFYRDAPSGTVSVHEDERGVRSLRVNNQYGLSQTSLATVEMQYTLGHLPMLLHAHPERALLIGFATGTSLSAMAEYGIPVDCVELHPSVVETAPLFAGANQRVYEQPNVRISIDDGRRFLARTQERYDVVVGDLYLPRNPGVGTMYSVEHFEQVKNHLTEDGVFVAWLPLFQMGPTELRAIVAAFLEVFPDANAWVGNWVLEAPVLGLVGGAPHPSGTVDNEVQRRVAASIARWQGRPTPSMLLQPNSDATWPRRQLLSTNGLRALSAGAKPNRIEHPIVEFGAPRSLMTATISGTSLAAQNLRLLAGYHDERRWKVDPRADTVEAH